MAMSCCIWYGCDSFSNCNGILVHLLHASRHQSETDARLHQTEHRKDVVHTGDNLWFKPGNMKGFLEARIGGKAFRQ
ncbi:Uncharacterised protein [Citrobacter koseri]|uniref:Uncharacterized protein n=1 Tax=Citrobacter koseri TaxID=545 RepID=A0A2X2YGS4_CITKO|nr:Uncharacterised protein [Citrobacter koseri]